MLRIRCSWTLKQCKIIFKSGVQFKLISVFQNGESSSLIRHNSNHHHLIFLLLCYIFFLGRSNSFEQLGWGALTYCNNVLLLELKKIAIFHENAENINENAQYPWTLEPTRDSSSRKAKDKRFLEQTKTKRLSSERITVEETRRAQLLISKQQASHSYSQTTAETEELT